MAGAWRQRVATLTAAGSLQEAAALAAEHGAHERASALYEQACAFSRAAAESLSADDPQRALRLAVIGDDEAVRERAVHAVLAAGPDERIAAAADDLMARGHPAVAAELLRRLGRPGPAAEAYQRAALPALAAACWVEAGEPAKAARVLESAIRGGLADAAPLQLALGELYARFGKHRAAVRVLQRLEPGSELRRQALPALAASLEALGLRQALADLQPELARAAVPAPVDVAPPTAAPGGATVLFGRYRVEQELAVTPHARLLRATDLVASRPVALKLLLATGSASGRDALSRFVREAKALGRLHHPHVVPLHDYLPEGPALVLGWMAGGSLRELVAARALSPARAAEITGAVLSALAEAHRLGILHRDVKPSNVLFDGGGAAHLSDFGAAHLAASGATVTIGEIGTAAYMSPEQRRGEAACVQSDLYGAGAVLFEMLTGAPPRGNTTVSAAHPDLGPAHDAVLARLLAQRAPDRYADATEAGAALLALSWSTRVVARPSARQGADVHTTAEPSAATGDRLAPARYPVMAADAGPRWHDARLGRDVVVLPLGDQLLARASAYARAGHAALGAVLRADEDQGRLWLEAPRGEPLRAGAPLTQVEHDRLRAALEALHAGGGVHGAVDADHVLRFGGGIVLSFHAAGADVAPADDLRGLAELAGRGAARG